MKPRHPKTESRRRSLDEEFTQSVSLFLEVGQRRGQVYCGGVRGEGDERTHGCVRMMIGRRRRWQDQTWTRIHLWENWPSSLDSPGQHG